MSSIKKNLFLFLFLIAFSYSYSIESDDNTGSFGKSIKLSNSETKNDLKIIIGNPGNNNNKGKVQVFVYNSTFDSWGNGILNKSAPESAFSDPEFGSVVDISDDGTTLAVGAPKWGNDPVRAGGVWVYDDTDGNWSQNKILTGSNTRDQIGTSVNLSKEL